MQDRHSNKEQYFAEQIYTTAKYVIPYIQSVMTIDSTSRVLEVGCGEGGNLAPFAEMGCYCRGIDINKVKVDLGNQKLKVQYPDADIDLIYGDIYTITPDDLGTYDLVFLRDVIEHLPDQEAFIRDVHQFLRPGGRVFFGYPPWYMPFGGHQQVMDSKLMSKVPYFHLLPRPMYRSLLKMAGENQIKVDNLLDIKETGISIERFMSYVKRHGYQVDRSDFWFINPNYDAKFKLTPKRGLPLLSSIPFLRNFVTTCHYCVISRPS